MKLPALLIAVFVAAGVLAASPIAVHSRYGLELSLGIALACIIAGFAFAGFRRANLAWTAGLLTWFFLAAAAAQIERMSIPANQITNLVASGQLGLDEPLRWRGILRDDPLRLPWISLRHRSRTSASGRRMASGARRLAGNLFL
jgi:hypothetical protein